ncbi:MAG: hypothetical protein HYW64_01200 [Candidatus Levybacteria bacterium]|nr:hypothetical protein [Candidatus Levybacteria bacterium]
MAPSYGANSVVRWVAPQEGKISISGYFQRCCTEAGDFNYSPRTIYSIRRNNEVLWTQDANDQTKYNYSLLTTIFSPGEKIEFWADANKDSGWDGTNFDFVISFMPSLSPTLPPGVTPTTAPQRVEGDANGDNSVDILDFNIWRDEFLGNSQTKQADFNGDGVVDLLDFTIWRNAIAAPSPSPTSPPNVPSPTPSSPTSRATLAATNRDSLTPDGRGDLTVVLTNRTPADTRTRVQGYVSGTFINLIPNKQYTIIMHQNNFSGNHLIRSDLLSSDGNGNITFSNLRFDFYYPNDQPIFAVGLVFASLDTVTNIKEPCSAGNTCISGFLTLPQTTPTLTPSIQPGVGIQPSESSLNLSSSPGRNITAFYMTNTTSSPINYEITAPSSFPVGMYFAPIGATLQPNQPYYVQLIVSSYVARGTYSGNSTITNRNNNQQLTIPIVVNIQ